MRTAAILWLLLAFSLPAVAAGLNDMTVTVPAVQKLGKAQNLNLYVPKMSFKGLPGAAGDLYVPMLSFKGKQGAVGDLFVPEMSFKGLPGAIGDLYVPEMSFKGLPGAAGDLYVPAMSFKGKTILDTLKKTAERPVKPLQPGRSAGGLGAQAKPAARAVSKTSGRLPSSARATPSRNIDEPRRRSTSPSTLPAPPEEPYKP
jgi:hypothetical protein